MCEGTSGDEHRHCTSMSIPAARSASVARSLSWDGGASTSEAAITQENAAQEAWGHSRHVDTMNLLSLMKVSSWYLHAARPPVSLQVSFYCLMMASAPLSPGS